MTLARAFVVTKCWEKRLLLGVGMQREGDLGGEPRVGSPMTSPPGKAEAEGPSKEMWGFFRCLQGIYFCHFNYLLSDI